VPDTAPVDLAFHPLTPDRWTDLEALFGVRGACGGCWCMVWRVPRAAWEAGKGDGNREAFRTLVESGAEPGILAYHGDVAVGWCAVAPRTLYPALERSRILKPVDDQPVWSVSCLFVAKAYRRKGVMTALLDAAAVFATSHGATIVEGYPVEPRSPNMPGPFAWTGVASAFQRAGYSEVARNSPTRPIMRRSVC
jgi:GNAT superfamily N-acetyltransferase